MGNFEVPATVHNLAGIQLATGLARDQVSVETVEHLLAALDARRDFHCVRMAWASGLLMAVRSAKS